MKQYPNTILKDMLSLIKSSHYILIVTHKNPDADTIGSALALSNFMFENKIKHKVYNISNQIPRNLNFLPKFDKITTILPKFYDLIIYVDCADSLRVGIEFDKNIKTINIDHHQSNTNFATLNFVDDTRPSTAEVVYKFFETNNITISKNTASALYVAIYDDSIAFTTPRVDKQTFETIKQLLESKIDINYISTMFGQRDSLAKYRILPKILDTLELYHSGDIATVYVEPRWLEETGATYYECDEVVNMVLNIAVVKVAVYLRIIDKVVRVSLRSKDNYDVSIVANHFDGGGHKNASGCSIDTTNISEAKAMVVKDIEDCILS